MSNLMVDLPLSQLRVRRNSDASGRPIIVLHDAIGSSDTTEPISRSFIGFRPVIALDLPGHGESITNRTSPTVANQAKAVLNAADALGIGEFDIFGVAAGALVGLEVGVQAAKRVKHIALADTPYLSKDIQQKLRQRQLPSLEVDWFGGHLIHAWHFVRDQELFSMWPGSNARDELFDPTQIDPDVITRKVLEIFRAPSDWRATYMAQFAYPVKQRLQSCKASILLCARAPGPYLALALNAKRDYPHLELRLLPSNPAMWVPTTRDFFRHPQTAH
jgi:pimeloyl-ACP methyl ester carboxylesterase